MGGHHLDPTGAVLDSEARVACLSARDQAEGTVAHQWLDCPNMQHCAAGEVYEYVPQDALDMRNEIKLPAQTVNVRWASALAASPR